MRQVTDPVADQVAEELIQQKNIRAAVGLLDFLARNDASVNIQYQGFEMPPLMKQYFSNMTPFEFSEKEKEVLDTASGVFEMYGPIITATLGVRSLLKQYAHTKATNVLRMTTLLTEYTDRRITETFQFVLDVMQKKWYEPDKRGIRSIQKLRLIHALIRYRILHGMTESAQGAWNMDWGLPINQEDMIFANQTFSVEIIQGLQQAGFHLSEQEREDYMYAWNLIGRALGVDPSLQADNFDEGAALQQQIYNRHFTLPNHNGPPLAAALIKFFMDIIPFNVSQKSIITIVKYFDGVESYPILRDHLNIDIDNAEENLAKHLHQELRATDEIEEQQGFSTMSHEDLAAGNYPEHLRIGIIEIFMNKLLRELFKRKRGSKSTSFQIDDALAEKWGLPGNEGIPVPQGPNLEDLPKKNHPLMKLLYDIGNWFMGLIVKVREWLKAK
jgi:hypothetical protein